ncbi:MAG: DUF1634 domain-containing protein [Calditrichota bacterium]|jgi:uncharacterized membrane protein
MAILKNQVRIEDIQKFISKILITGVIISTLFVLAGGLLYLISSGSGIPKYHVFKGEPAGMKSILAIIKNLFTLRSEDIIQFGLLLLMLTPVARVLFTVITFLHEKDYIYVLVTFIVLSVLCFSLISGGA